MVNIIFRIQPCLAGSSSKTCLTILALENLSKSQGPCSESVVHCDVGSGLTLKSAIGCLIDDFSMVWFAHSFTRRDVIRSFENDVLSLNDNGDPIHRYSWPKKMRYSNDCTVHERHVNCKHHKVQGHTWTGFWRCVQVGLCYWYTILMRYKILHLHFVTFSYLNETQKIAWIKKYKKSITFSTLKKSAKFTLIVDLWSEVKLSLSAAGQSSLRRYRINVFLRTHTHRIE